MRFLDQEPGQPFYVMAWTSATHHPYEPGPGLEPQLDQFLRGTRGAVRRLEHEPLPEPREGGRPSSWAGCSPACASAASTSRPWSWSRATTVRPSASPTRPGATDPRLYDEFVKVPMYVWAPRLVRPRAPLQDGGQPRGPESHHRRPRGPARRPSWSGRSLFDRTRSPRAYFYAAHDDYRLGLREGERKYIYNATTGRRPALRPRHRSRGAAEPGRAVSRRSRLASASTSRPGASTCGATWRS